MQINISWDKEACVWIAECEKLGLVLESGSYDALLERVKTAILELIELNHITNRNFTVDGKIKSRQTANAIMKQSGIDYHF